MALSQRPKWIKLNKFIINYLTLVRQVASFIILTVFNDYCKQITHRYQSYESEKKYFFCQEFSSDINQNILTVGIYQNLAMFRKNLIHSLV